jgi:medium-chain acyl-[acyl-carrier-protein] hydrolase
MGSLLAFELARALRERGAAPPVHLFVSCGRGPQLPSRHPRVHDLPAEAFLAELRRLEGTPAALLESPELMEALLPLLRADFAICDRYTYRPAQPLGCPITVFGGLSDPTVTREECLGWGEQTSGPFTLRMMLGGHFVVHEQPRAVAQHIARSLEA